MHTATFTHRCVYTQTLLLTDSFTHRSFYSQMLVHANAFTHTHMRPFTPGPRKLEQMHCHTKKLSHPDPVTYRPCYTVDAVRRPGSEMSTLVHFQLIGSLQEQKLARKKITESDDCLSSSWILPAQKDDATFLFCPDGRATKPSGFHTASKKSSVPTGLLPASLWSRSRKPCRAAWTGQQEDLSSPQSAAEVHVEPSGWLPCIELSTDRHGAVPIFQGSKVGTIWFFKHQMALLQSYEHMPHAFAATFQQQSGSATCCCKWVIYIYVCLLQSLNYR